MMGRPKGSKDKHPRPPATHCRKAGHAYTADDFVASGGRVYRRCSACMATVEYKQRDSRYQAAKRARRAARQKEQARLVPAAPGACVTMPNRVTVSVDTKKVCRKCKVEKPLTEYYPKRTVRSGTTSFCKACIKVSRWAAHRKRRRLLLWHYSGGTMACACCGEA